MGARAWERTGRDLVLGSVRCGECCEFPLRDTVLKRKKQQ